MKSGKEIMALRHKADTIEGFVDLLEENKVDYSYATVGDKTVAVRVKFLPDDDMQEIGAESFILTFDRKDFETK